MNLRYWLRRIFTRRCDFCNRKAEYKVYGRLAGKHRSFLSCQIHFTDARGGVRYRARTVMPREVKP